jgi:hypothetical protein
MKLIDKYLNESGSPLGFTYNLMDDQLDDFIKLLRTETDELKDKNLNNEFNKLLKQHFGFKKALKAYVKRLI